MVCVIRTAAFGCFASVCLCQKPIEMHWNTKTTYGPDGPWQAVSVSVGTNNQQLDLYPGGWFETDILSTVMCQNRPDCASTDAGHFDPSSSKPEIRPGQFEPSGFVDQWNAGPETNLTGNAEFMVDKLSFGSSAGSIEIPNTMFSLISQSNIELPNGTSYRTQVGYLALGGPEAANQPKALVNGSQAGGNILTGYLQQNDKIPSNSWGLQIGSVPQGQEGSLILGGFAKDRALGPVGTYTLGGIGGEPVVSLIGVTLDVESGGTPFNTSKVGELYRPGSSKNVSVPVSLNPTVPYMMLPIGQCEAIAEFLPVQMNSELGLFTWNTNDPQFSRIVNSPSFIAFTFQMNATGDLTIKVPFSVLNLTLEPPLVASPQSYFPCKPHDSSNGRYFMGRAFLQAAYLATRWELNKFFLAQAAGPKSGPSDIIPFQLNDNDAIMESSAIDGFATSWQDKWTEIDRNDNGTASSNSTGTSSQGLTASSTSSGLPTSAKAGAAIGATLAVLSISALAYFIFRRRRQQQQQRASSSSATLPALDTSQLYDPHPPPYWSKQHCDKPLPPLRGTVCFTHEMEVPMNSTGTIQEADSRGIKYEADSGEIKYEADSMPVRLEADSREVGNVPMGRSHSTFTK